MCVFSSCSFCPNGTAESLHSAFSDGIGESLIEININKMRIHWKCLTLVVLFNNLVENTINIRILTVFFFKRINENSGTESHTLVHDCLHASKVRRGCDPHEGIPSYTSTGQLSAVSVMYSHQIRRPSVEITK